MWAFYQDILIFPNFIIQDHLNIPQTFWNMNWNGVSFVVLTTIWLTMKTHSQLCMNHANPSMTVRNDKRLIKTYASDPKTAIQNYTPSKTAHLSSSLTTKQILSSMTANNSPSSTDDVLLFICCSCGQLQWYSTDIFIFSLLTC